MHGLGARDPGRSIDWGKTSPDYARFRPGYPEGFYQVLRGMGVGLPGQRLLDLGTGTGVVARAMARAGCQVTGIDPSSAQILEAARLAMEEGLPIDLRVGRAEETGLPSHAWDILIAAQAWLYFDRDAVVAEAFRLLAPGGRLVTCHMCWLPRVDPIARRTEELVLRFNPQWSAADFSGEIPVHPSWIREDFVVSGMCFYDEPIAYTRETWRGRIRACRGVGAALDIDEVERFDQEHARLLEASVPEQFTVLHRLDAHVLTPSRAIVSA